MNTSIETLAEDCRTVEELTRVHDSGARLKYVFFWGHTPHPDGRISASCFSQWWQCNFNVNGKNYPTAEHFMMAAKARLFGDSAIETQILQAESAGEAKKLGRQVQNFSEGIWQQSRFDLVVEGNLAKSSQNPELKDFLLSTNSSVLVEASPRECIWGIGRGRNSMNVEDPHTWRGLNLLGFALMEVRARLQPAS